MSAESSKLPDFRTTKAQAMRLAADIEEALGVDLTLSFDNYNQFYELGDGKPGSTPTPVGQLLWLQSQGPGKFAMLATGGPTWVQAVTPKVYPDPPITGGPTGIEANSNKNLMGADMGPTAGSKELFRKIIALASEGLGNE